MNKNPTRVEALNQNKYLEYKCKDNNRECISIIQNEDEVQAIFTNGRLKINIFFKP